MNINDIKGQMKFKVSKHLSVICDEMLNALDPSLDYKFEKYYTKDIVSSLLNDIKRNSRYVNTKVYTLYGRYDLISLNIITKDILLYLSIEYIKNGKVFKENKIVIYEGEY